MAQQEYNIMQSLFGFTPENVQKQALQTASDRAMALTKLSAGQGGSPVSLFYGLEGAERFGARPIFGPSAEQQKAASMQSIIQQVQAQGIDVSTPDGQIALAQELSRNPEFAGIATALRQQAAKTSLEAQKAGAEMFEKTTAGYKNIAAATKEKEPQKVGTSQATGEIVYIQNGQQFTINADGSRKPFSGSVRDTATKIDLSGLGDAMMKAQAGQEGKEKAESWAKAGEVYRLSVPLLDQLDTAYVAAQNAYTGAGADYKLALSKMLSAFNIPISPRAQDSEYVNAISSKLVQRIAKNFPGSQAIKELEQLIKSKPNLSQELPTVLRLLQEVSTEIRAETLTYEQLSKLPKDKRYEQDVNIVSGENYRKITRYRELLSKIQSKTATRPEAEEALTLQKELGMK